MTVLRLMILAILLLAAFGCVPKSRYAWNSYDNKLYQHYKNPAEYEQFVESLREVINEGEKEGKVPPGLYAEYGFVLYEKGDFPEAVRYFRMENDKWPESRVLMAKMIQNAEKRSKQARPIQKSPPANIDKADSATVETKGVGK